MCVYIFVFCGYISVIDINLYKYIIEVSICVFVNVIITAASAQDSSVNVQMIVVLSRCTIHHYDYCVGDAGYV